MAEENRRIEPLHLDTARIGRLCPASLEVLESFGRFLARNGRIPSFSAVLEDGFGALPNEYQTDFPALSVWKGLRALQDDIAMCAEAGSGAFVAFSAQSAALMVFAAHVLGRKARKILCTDLEFPLLQRVLSRVQEQYGGTLEVLPLRHLIEGERYDAAAIAKRIVDFYVQNDCEAIVISQITQEGIRIPCESIIKTLRMLDSSCLVMVDGAQSLELEFTGNVASQADIYFGVTHKWMEGASLGLAIAPRETSVGIVKATLKDMVDEYLITDPYLRLIAHASGLSDERIYETISLEQLFVSAAAVRIALSRKPEERTQRYDAYRDFTFKIDDLTSRLDCNVRRRDSELRTGIALVDWPKSITGMARDFEAELGKAGIVVTGLTDRSVRISAPTTTLFQEDWQTIHRALELANKDKSAAGHA